MTPYERGLIFDVAGGIHDNLPFIHQIHQGLVRGTEMLEWLKHNGVVGESFKQFARDHGGSKIRMGAYILKKMEKVKSRQIYVKDLK